MTTSDQLISSIKPENLYACFITYVTIRNTRPQVEGNHIYGVGGLKPKSQLAIRLGVSAGNNVTSPLEVEKRGNLSCAGRHDLWPFLTSV